MCVCVCVCVYVFDNDPYYQTGHLFMRSVVFNAWLLYISIDGHVYYRDARLGCVGTNALQSTLISFFFKYCQVRL